ncbi:YhgE/Pip domain-containing protein [Bacillus sp. FJAT-47783]|uniref:YhgE/Pip domain-containing protein n=1 Tax=Bacillus sp. FJAT-47783 TaxID=2922712 RepID=UPI001FAE67EB|nr:YhgE/Pip domain-containing protein [Bacillus sp. FJAT-47783]
MKKIFQIYKTDWQNIFKVPIAVFLIAGLMVLPSLYAWFNLKAAWDPYGDTSGIAIAVTNEDEGTVIHNNEIHKEINVGEEVVNSLKENKKLGWTFVSKEEAHEGMRHGDYYASLLIPKDFSAKLATILEDNPESPEIQYIVNEKINAIAPKITAKGATGVTDQINESFVKSVSEALLKEFNRIGIELEKELPTIRHIENRLFELEEHLPEIEKAGDQLLAFEQKLPEIREKGEKIVVLEDKLPEINHAASYVLKLEKELPKIKEVGNEIVAIQEKLPSIQQVADRVVEIDQNFYKIEDAINRAIENANKADEVISSAKEALNEIEKIAKNGEELRNKLEEFIKENAEAFNAIAPSVKQNIALLQQSTDAVTQLAEALQQGNEDPKSFRKDVSSLEKRIETGGEVIERTANLFEKMNGSNQSFAPEIQRLNTLQSNFEQQKGLLKRVQQSIAQGNQPNESDLAKLQSLSSKASNDINDLLANFDKETIQKINQFLEELRSSTENASDRLNKAKEMLPEIKGILEDADKTIDYGRSELERIQKELPEIKEKVHEAAQEIQEKMNLLVEGINQAAAFVQDDLPGLEKKVHEAANFVRNDLPKVEEEVHKVSDFIQTKLPEVEETVHKLANLVRTDLPKLEQSVKNAANKIRDFKQSKDLEEIIALLKNDVQNESDFITNPIHLKEEKMFHIPNYGSAMSPFYTTLSLWVGALLLVSMLRFDVEDANGMYNSHHIYFGRLLTFLTIGFFQALIVSLGDMFILGAYVAEPVWFVLSSIFISIVFMTIVYTFVSVFGNIGKAFAIVMLVLQLSASGGTFPVQVTPPLFQAIHPFLPFTYGISLMRETVGGMVAGIVRKDVICLFLFLCSAFLLGVVLKKPLSKSTERVTKMAKKSKIIH